MAKKFFFALAACAAIVFCGCFKQNDALVMITETAFPPYAYLEGSEIVGIDVEICKAIAERLGRPLKVHSTKFESVISSVLTGEADFGAAGITITEDRKHSVNFSIPYVTSGIVIVSKKGAEYKDVASINGKRIGVQSATTSDSYCVVELGQVPQRFDSPTMAATALLEDKVDLIIVDIDPAKVIVTGDESLVISSDYLSKEEFAVAINKNRPDILEAANAVIAELLKEGKIEAWKAEHDARSKALQGAN